jgi:gluconolactonase
VIRTFLLVLMLTGATCVAQHAVGAVEPLASGFEGGEGPVWMPGGHLLFSDTRTEKIHKVVPGQMPTVFREVSHGANGNAVDRQGRLYTCEYKSRRVTRTNKQGQVEVLAERFEGKRFNAPNDIVVRRDGHVFFTDPLFTPLDSRELDFYGVFHITPTGTVSLVAKSTGRPNGLALSPNGKILYVADTDNKNVLAYDLDNKGNASNERIVVKDLPGGPDGLKTDSKGNLYIASRGVQIYTPAGIHIGSIEVTDGVRNVAFGDADFKSLYITGRTTLYRVRLDVKGARP